MLNSIFPGQNVAQNIGGVLPSWMTGLPSLPSMPSSFNQQLAPSTPYQDMALAGFGPMTANALGLIGMGQNTMANLATNPGTLPGTSGVLGAMNNLSGIGGMLGGIGGVGSGALPGMNTLSDFASGKYLSPSTNPNLQAYYNAAAAPMTQQFQNAIAPEIMANAAQTGSVGGTGATTAMNQAQFGLGQGLSNLAAGIYEPAYMQGQQLQQGAASTMGQLGLGQGQLQLGQQQNQISAANAMTGANSVMGNLGLGLGGLGLNQQQMQLAAAQGLPGMAMAGYQPLSALYGAGATQQQGAQNQLDVTRSNAMQQFQFPFQLLSMLGSAFGGTSGAGGQTTSISPIIGGGMGGKM
jgi:hypothetical protein